MCRQDGATAGKIANAILASRQCDRQDSGIRRSQLRRDRDAAAEGPRHRTDVGVKSEDPLRDVTLGGVNRQTVMDMDAPDHQHLAIQLDLARRLRR